MVYHISVIWPELNSCAKIMQLQFCSVIVECLYLLYEHNSISLGQRILKHILFNIDLCAVPSSPLQST